MVGRRAVATILADLDGLGYGQGWDNREACGAVCNDALGCLVCNNLAPIVFGELEYFSAECRVKCWETRDKTFGFNVRTMA
jgi:hypothetical protein